MVEFSSIIQEDFCKPLKLAMDTFVTKCHSSSYPSIIPPLYWVNLENYRRHLIRSHHKFGKICQNSSFFLDQTKQRAVYKFSPSHHSTYNLEYYRK